MIRVWMSALGIAFSAASYAADVTVSVGDAVINWTELTVECTKVGTRSGVGASQQAIEQFARRQLGPALVVALESLDIAPGVSLDGIDPKLQEAIRARVALWSVHEARYYRSGKVALEARLDLQGLLKPWTLSVARPAPRAPRQADFTGLVIDARGLDFEAVYAPRLQTAEGDEVYGGFLWDDVAVEVAPVIYVGAASDAAVVRAGSNPMFLRASRVGLGGALVIESRDARELARRAEGTRILGEGKIVVVLGDAR